MSVLRFLCLVVTSIFAALGPVSAQDRHALVIGIDAYENLGSLEKAVNDGRAMADSLARAGFTVDAGYDLDRRGFVRLLTQFLNRLEPDDEALVFYAGHAVAIENDNFLVPADASALEQSSEALIIAESIGQEFLLDQITATGVRLTVVIMDACRNNPFEGLSTRSLGRDAGLAITQPPRGVFMMYSADEGQTALDRLSNDDPHPNSVFTRTLLPLIEEPGIDIVDIARRLRGDVQELAASVQHQQFPVYRDRMQGEGRFVVRPAAAVVEQPAPVADPAPVAVAPPANDPCAAARADWSLVGEGPSAAILEAYLAAHGDCPLMATLASERLAALSATPAPQEPAPAVPDTPSTALGGAVTQLVAACVAAAHPDTVPWDDLQDTAALFTAERACNAALEALPDQTSAEYFHVTALLGRVENRRGNYAAAHELYRVAAEAGDPIGAYNFAFLYESGEGVAVNGDHAVRWYRRAGEYGRSAGWYRVGILHLNGDIVPQDYDVAVDGLMRAAEMGDGPAMNRLGLMYRSGTGVTQSDRVAFDWFQRGAEAGYSDSMLHLGFAYLMGRGTSQDERAAARWYRAGSDAGQLEARARLGLLYLNGTGVQQNTDTGLELLTSGAEAGSTYAMHYLAEAYQENPNVAENPTLALRWYTEAADAGYARSAAELGFIYFYGDIVARSFETSANYFMQAAEAGNLTGMRNIGLFYRNGTSVRQDQTEATRWLRQAAERGDASSIFYLGAQYEYGRGVRQSNTEAARLYMQALAAGEDRPIRHPDEFTAAVARELQTLLRQAGHYNGAIDGAIGPGTVAAMQSYMDAN